MLETSYWLPDLDELVLFGPDFALVGTLVLILAGAALVSRKASVVATLATVGIVIAFLLNVNVAHWVSFEGKSGMQPGDGAMLLADNLTVFFKFAMLVFVLCVTMLWWIGSARQEENAPEFFVLLLGSALGMSLMVSTLNVLMIIIAIELASLPSYAIVAFDKGSRGGAEGSIKYAIFGSASAGLMLYGASLIFGLYGTLDIPTFGLRFLADMQSETQGDAILPALAMFLFLVGIGFKISAVPFHFWCPDVFEGAKVEVTTWLSVVSKVAGIGLLLRIFFTLAVLADESSLSIHPPRLDALLPWTLGIGVVAAVTCLWGNLAAYRQTSVKRLLAYSSIAHAGYMLMLGAVILARPVAEDVWLAFFVYIMMYLLMNLGAFGCTALVTWQSGSDHIDRFDGLGRRAPLVAVALTICLFSLVGLPPLGGFIAKWWLLVALAGGGGWLWFLIIWAALNTLLSLFYYLRVIKHMYFVDSKAKALSVPIRGVVLVNACALLLILSGTLMVPKIRNTAESFSRYLYPNMEVILVDAQDPEKLQPNTASTPIDGNPGGAFLNRDRAPRRANTDRDIPHTTGISWNYINSENN